jgi:uncharacterized tellurite resistance protein B-like protein
MGLAGRGARRVAFVSILIRFNPGLPMLVDSIRALLHGHHDAATPAAEDAAAGVDPVHLAACTLLLEIAYADGEFSPSERTQLEAVLARHFNLDADAGRQLIELAERERAKSVDYFHYTSTLRQNYSLGQKMVLAEIMWGLVLADGTVADREQYLTRKIANLLDLEPGYLSQAKAAARKGK